MQLASVHAHGRSVYGIDACSDGKTVQKKNNTKKTRRWAGLPNQKIVFHCHMPFHTVHARTRTHTHTLSLSSCKLHACLFDPILACVALSVQLASVGLDCKTQVWRIGVPKSQDVPIKVELAFTAT